MKPLYLFIISILVLVCTNITVNCTLNQSCKINSFGFLVSILFIILIQLSIPALVILSVKNSFKFKKFKSLFLTLLAIFVFLGGFPRRIGLILGIKEWAFGFEPGILYPYERFQQIQIINYLGVFFTVITLSLIYMAFKLSLKNQ
jgi:hypothetical protein